MDQEGEAPWNTDSLTPRRDQAPKFPNHSQLPTSILSVVGSFGNVEGYFVAHSYPVSIELHDSVVASAAIVAESS
jgi:hypothetical protein